MDTKWEWVYPDDFVEGKRFPTQEFDRMNGGNWLNNNGRNFGAGKSLRNRGGDNYGRSPIGYIRKSQRVSDDERRMRKLF